MIEIKNTIAFKNRQTVVINGTKNETVHYMRRPFEVIVVDEPTLGFSKIEIIGPMDSKREFQISLKQPVLTATLINNLLTLPL